jgi:hypothetical protein
MNLLYALPLLALLAALWVIVRYVAEMARRRRAALKEQKRRSSVRISKGPDSASERSDMRRTDAPATFVDTIQKRTQPPRNRRPSKPRTER